MSKSPLYILHHAGGAAYFYRKFEELLSIKWEVRVLEFPGHGKRAREKLICNMEELALDLLGHIQPVGHGHDWAIFGHSMGALLAYDICTLLDRETYPQHLFVSGTSFPLVRKKKRISSLPSSQFWEAVINYGAVPKEILTIDDLREYFEPILRCDFRAVENYQPEMKVLDIPITVFWGTSDMTKEDASSWKELTSRNCALHAFEGGHFFLFEHIQEIVKIINSHAPL